MRKHWTGLDVALWRPQIANRTTRELERTILTMRYDISMILAPMDRVSHSLAQKASSAIREPGILRGRSRG